MDVGLWLRGLGLGQYEAAFRENEIGGDVLPNLTADDLKELGVTVVGHRRKLLTAIASLDRSLPASDMAATAPPPPPRDQHARDTAERRQLTVMFVDLVGSTAMSARLDPEDMREIVGAYHRSCAEQITKAGGFVAKYMGDGVLTYFGYPQAHEHDAERAVLAGLALAEAVPKLKTAAGTPLQVRVGIATGLVVVGDLIGSGEAQERGVVGDTPNLAARLQALAEPNMVVIADGTRRLLGNLFELKDLGTRDLKGIAGPARAWAALRASSVESRFDALHTTNLTALVGREEESELLLRRWSRAKTGEGQVVLISGEAGIGKSRLAAAVLERLATEPHTRLRYFCSPQHTDSALHPFIGQMERAAGLAYDDNPRAKLDKLDALLAQTSTSTQDAAIFAEMLSLPNDGRYPALALTPEQRRQRTLEALTSQLEALTRQQPVLMIFEDVHWIDPTSLELLSRAVDRIATLRGLLIVTFRLEFEPPWIGRPHVMALTVNRLARREIDAMIDRVVGDKPLPASIRQDIVERADGIPLFVEELTKAVMEAGADDGGAGKMASSAPHPGLNVPATLHASLMARLDRLGAMAKEIAQVGAAIGREFSYELLTLVAQRSEEELNASLKRLINSGLVFCRGRPPQAMLLFKHALVRDVAYGTLLRGDRQQSHARIAQALEEQLQQTAPEILAHHFSEARAPDKAIAYWLQAGQIASLRSANTEALSHLKKGLALLDQLPDARERNLRELSLRTALGAVYVATKGYSAAETVATFKRAAELSQATEDTRPRLAIHNGLLVGYYNLAQFDNGLDLAQVTLQQAERDGDEAAICVGHRMMAAVCNSMGEFERAAYHGRRGWELYQPERHGLAALGLVHDTGLGAKMHLALALCQLGFQHQAKKIASEVLSMAVELRHANTQAYAWFFAGVLMSFISCDHSALSEYAQGLRAYAQQHGLPQWAAYGRAFGALSLVTSGHACAAVDELTGAISDCERIQNFVFRPAHLTILALAELAAGRAEHGTRCYCQGA